MMYDRIPTRVSISMSLIEELKMEFAGRIVGAQAGLAVAGAAYYFATRSKEKYTPADEITADTVLSAASSIVKACRSYGFVCTRSFSGPKGKGKGGAMQGRPLRCCQHGRRWSQSGRG